MEKAIPLFYINLFGYNLPVTLSLFIQWIIVALVSVFVFIGRRRTKKIPDKHQSALEIFVETINKIVVENMGEGSKRFVPFIGTLSIYLLLMNIVGLFGFQPPTTDYSVTLGMGLISFLIIQGYAIKKVGLRHYFLGYAKPISVLLPINIMERFIFPISLSLRLFGNMFAATIIIELIYHSLSEVAWIAQLGLPVPLHFYFDIFDGTIQMAIFVMLTMINIKIISEH